MSRTTTEADPRFGVARGLGGFAIAAVCAWEYFRTGDPGLRVVMPVVALNGLVIGVVAIARRHQPRPAPTTRYPRAVIATSLFPLGLAGGAVWYFTRSSDFYYLLIAPPLLDLGVSVRCLAAPGVLSAQRLVTADRCDCSTRCGESPSATRRFAVKPANTGSTALPLVP